MICFKCQDNVVCSPSLTGVCKEICCAKDRCNSTVGKREPIETTDPRKWHLKCADQSADEATNQTSTNSDTNQSSWVWVKIGYPNFFGWFTVKIDKGHLWYPGFGVLTHTHSRSCGAARESRVEIEFAQTTSPRYHKKTHKWIIRI